MTAVEDIRATATADGVPPADLRPPARARPASRPDWLALLPAGALGSVAVVGPLTDGARAALDAGRAARTGEPVDTVVLTDDRRRAVDLALARVRTGGTVRIERSTRRRRRALRRRLLRAGFQDVTTWWHRPSRHAARCLVRLDQPVAAATALRTVADRGRWSRSEALLARTGLASALSAEVSLLAVSLGADPVPPALAQPDDDRPIDALVTPRFASSRAVVGVSTTDAGRRLHRVAKVAGRREDDALIGAEATNLARLLERTGPFPGAPPAPRTVRRHGRTLLVEGAVRGRPLDRRAVRRDPLGALVSGRRWIDGLPVGAVTTPLEDGRAGPLLHEPLLAIAARPGPRAAERAALVERATGLLSPLERIPLPVVFEHGDLSHPNLFRHDDGTLAVVDWERARAEGLPLHDLTFLVAYLTESVERPRSPGELAAAVTHALRPHGWARAELDVHADRLGLDRRVLSRLQLACWTRRVAALPAEAEHDDRPRHRNEVLWRAAIDDVEGTSR